MGSNSIEPDNESLTMSFHSSVSYLSRQLRGSIKDTVGLGLGVASHSYFRVQSIRTTVVQVDVQLNSPESLCHMFELEKDK